MEFNILSCHIKKRHVYHEIYSLKLLTAVCILFAIRRKLYLLYAPSTRIRIFLNPQLFLCGFRFRQHVSGESGMRISKFLNLLSRVHIFEYMNPESCGR